MAPPSDGIRRCVRMGRGREGIGVGIERTQGVSGEENVARAERRDRSLYGL